jgi:hypothetical protein
MKGLLPALQTWQSKKEAIPFAYGINNWRLQFQDERVNT